MSDQLSSDLSSLRIRREATSRPSSYRKVIVVLVLLAAAAVGAVVAFQKLSSRLYKQEVAVAEVAMISPAQSSVVVTSTGYVVPQLLSRVGAKIPGRVAKVMVKEGDVVKAGDVIAVLDGADQRSAIAAAQSRAMVARAAVQTARASLAEVGVRVERARNLVRQKAMPAMELQDLEQREKVLAESVRVAEAQVAAAQAEVATWRVGLKDRVVIAPINGTVITKPAMVGETVGPQLTGLANIAEIADFSSIVVEVDVPEARLGLISVGSPAEIVLDAYPTRRYRGVVLDLGKRVNRAKATVVVKVKFKDTMEGVLPDMSARVSFLREELSDEALKAVSKKVVPVEAVVQRQRQGQGQSDDGKFVFVVEDGKLRMTKIATGATVGGSIELLDGPPVGARVVRKPTSDTFDGQRVKVPGGQ